MATMLGSLLVSLGLESAQFKRGIKGAKQDVDGFSRFAKVGLAAVATAAAGAAAGLALMVRNSINVADEISKAAQKVGIGTEELSRLRYAAELSGLSFQQLQTGVGRLNRNMVETARGTGAARTAFAQLGISVKDTDGRLRTSTEIMGDVADKFASMEDGAEKSALAMEIFGKSGADLIPMLNGGREALEKLTGEADRFGIVIDAETGRKAEAFNDNLTRLQGVFGALATQIAAELLPALVDLTDWAVRNGSAVRGMASEFSKAVQGMVFLTNKAMEAARALRDFFAPAVDMARRGLRALGLGGSGGNSYLDVINSLKNAGRETAPVMTALGASGDIAAGGLRRATGAARGASAAIRETRDELLDLVERLYPDRTTRAQMSQLELIEKDIERLKSLGITREQARRRVLGIDGPADVSKGLLGEGPLNGEVSKRLDDFVKDVTEARAATMRATRAIGESFGQMADRTLQALDRMTSAIKGGGFLDILGSVLNLGLQLGGLGAFGKGFQAKVNAGVPGFANGTRFAPGGLAMVGERGPELVNLPRGSQVIPNRELSSMGGGGSIAQIVPSKYFDVVVDGRIVRASPAIMQGGANAAQSQMSRMQSRRVG
jgi:hypothetical protein